MARGERWDESLAYARKAAALGDQKARAMLADLGQRVHTSEASAFALGE
jgi:hypothetical protein